MNSLPISLADTNLVRVRPVVASNEATEPDEEPLPLPLHSMSGRAESVVAENFNPNHDELGRFTFADGAGGGGAQQPTGGAPGTGQTGSTSGSGGSGAQQPIGGAPGAGQTGNIPPGSRTNPGGSQDPDSNGGTDPKKPSTPPDSNPYWGSIGGGKSGGGKSGGGSGGGSQKPGQGGIQVIHPQQNKPGNGATVPKAKIPQAGGPRMSKLTDTSGEQQQPHFQLFQMPSSLGSLSSAPYKADPWSGQSWAAVGREAVAQVSKMTGPEVLPSMPEIENDLRRSQDGNATTVPAGSSHVAETVHGLVPLLRKYHVACTDLSRGTKEDRSGVAQIAAHLQRGPVLATVSSGGNAHGELIMGQHKNGLFQVYHPAKGGEDLLHASQIDPRGVIALSPL